PLVAGDHVRVGVGEHVADVEGAGYRRGRGVDDEGLLAGLRGIPVKYPRRLPSLVLAPFRLGAVEMLGELRWSDRLERVHCAHVGLWGSTYVAKFGPRGKCNGPPRISEPTRPDPL